MSDSVKIYVPNSTLPGSGWPKRYNDAMIDEKTIFCYDTADPISYVKQAASVTNDTILNLVIGGDPAVITGSLPFSGGGLNFSVAAGQKIALPAAAKLADTTEDFMWAWWGMQGTQTQAVQELGGYHYADTGPYGLRSVGVSVYRAICGGVTQQFNMAPGSLYAVHIAREKVDALTYLFHLLVNGVLVGSAAMPVVLQQPTTAVSEAAIGDAVGTSYTGYWVGRHGRTWLTTKHLGLAKIKEKAALDWEYNHIGRFS